MSSKEDWIRELATMITCIREDIQINSMSASANGPTLD